MAHGLTALGFFFPSLGDHWLWWLWLERSWVHSAALAEWWYYHWADTVQQQKIRWAELNLPGAHRVTVWHQFSHKPTWLKKKKLLITPEEMQVLWKNALNGTFHLTTCFVHRLLFLLSGVKWRASKTQTKTGNHINIFVCLCALCVWVYLCVTI